MGGERIEEDDGEREQSRRPLRPDRQTDHGIEGDQPRPPAAELGRHIGRHGGRQFSTERHVRDGRARQREHPVHRDGNQPGDGRRIRPEEPPRDPERAEDHAESRKE